MSLGVIGVSFTWNSRKSESRDTWRPNKRPLKYIVYKQVKNNNIKYIRMRRKIINDYRLQYLNDLFEIKLIFYDLSSMLQFPQFVWPLSYSV